MRWLFWAVMAIALLLSVIEPALLKFVLLGLVVRAGVALLGRSRGDSGTGTSTAARRLIGGALLVAVLFALWVVAFPGFHGRRPAVARVELHATYQATGTVVPEDVIEVEELVSVAESDIAGALEFAPLVDRSRDRGVKPRTALRRALVRAFSGRGWTQAETNLGLEFRRTTRVELRARRFPGETTNLLDVPRLDAEEILPDQGAIGVPLALALPWADGSTITLVAPRHAIGDTFPAPARRDAHVRGDVEEVVVPVGPRTDQVEFELRSPWLRNGFLAPIADLSATGSLHWLVALLLGLATDGVKDAIKRLISRLRGKPADTKPASRPRRRRKRGRKTKG